MSNGDLIITGRENGTGFTARLNIDPNQVDANEIWKLPNIGGREILSDRNNPNEFFIQGSDHITKVDENGNVLFTYMTTGINLGSFSLAQQADGKLLSAGNFSGMVEFDTTNMTTSRTSSGASDQFIIEIFP